MEKNSIVHSYMLRCCLEPNGFLRVYVRQVHSGEEKYFTSLEEAAAFMNQQLHEARNEHD